MKNRKSLRYSFENIARKTVSYILLGCIVLSSFVMSSCDIPAGTLEVTNEEGEVITVPNFTKDYKSELGQEMTNDPRYAELKSAYKEFVKNNPYEHSNKGSYFNFTLDSYYENHDSLEFSEFDIQNNTFISAMAYDKDNNVYFFLQANTSRNPAYTIYLDEEKLYPEEFGFNLFTLLCYENLDTAIIQDLFNGEEFTRIMIAKELARSIQPVVMGEGFVSAASNFYFKDLFGVSTDSPIKAKAVVPFINGDEVTWYTMIETFDRSEVKVYISKTIITNTEEEEYALYDSVTKGVEMASLRADHVLTGEEIELQDYKTYTFKDFGSMYEQEKEIVN